jgi:hypothetical protein
MDLKYCSWCQARLFPHEVDRGTLCDACVQENLLCEREYEEEWREWKEAFFSAGEKWDYDISKYDVSKAVGLPEPKPKWAVLPKIASRTPSRATWYKDVNDLLTSPV